MSQRTTATGTILTIVEEKLPQNMLRRKNGILYGFVEVDGQQKRKSLGTIDVVDAMPRLERWLAEVCPRFATGEKTFAEVASSYIETYQDEHTKKTWHRYVLSMKLLKPHFGDKLWSEVTRGSVIEFVNFRKQQGVTNATINRDLAVLSNIFEHAIDQDWADDNPVRRLSRKSRRERRSPFVLPTDEMVEAAFARMRSQASELSRFALLTGLRMDEIVFLDWKDVNLEQRWVQLFVTKNQSVRVVPLSAEAFELLRKRNHRTGYVFTNRDDEPLTRMSANWREAVIRAAKIWPDHHPDQQFIRFRFHDLRHMFAIRYLRSGGNIYELQKILGHSTIRQTEAYLQYLTPEQQARSRGA
jgi:integrase